MRAISTSNKDTLIVKEFKMISFFDSGNFNCLKSLY